jgi:hypothetical protein
MTQQTNTKAMSKELDKKQETLHQYVSDMLATEKHILEAVERQRDDDSVKQQSQASQLISRIHNTLHQHTQQLDQHLHTKFGGGSAVKEAVTSTLGAVAGLYDKLRTKQVSRMLRDDYTALNMAAVGYTMLHTSGLALNDRQTADMALRNLKDLTPLITQINQVIPQVVAFELTEDHPGANIGSGAEAARNTQEAWSGQHVQQGSTISMVA